VRVNTGETKSTRERIPIISLDEIVVFSFNACAIAQSCKLEPSARMGEDGLGLVSVLYRLKNESPDRFQSLNQELARLLPEFDQILFRIEKKTRHIEIADNRQTRSQVVEGSLMLRLSESQEAIPAERLSQGTLIALALLTLAHLPDPPPIIGLEEPDRGIHPRLLRDIRDTLYRLS
jgi:predicted ATPase